MEYKSNEMGILGWLTILFIGLKLTGYITWSWIWVLSPIWIIIALFIVIMVIILLFSIIMG